MCRSYDRWGKFDGFRMYHALSLNGNSNIINAVKRQRNLGLRGRLLHIIRIFKSIMFWLHFTFAWKKMRCRFVLVPICLDTELSWCRTVFFNGCRNVLVPNCLVTMINTLGNLHQWHTCFSHANDLPSHCIWMLWRTHSPSRTKQSRVTSLSNVSKMIRCKSSDFIALVSRHCTCKWWLL